MLGHQYSLLRFYRRHIKSPLKVTKRQLIRSFTRPKLAYLYQKYLFQIAKENWPAVRQSVLNISSLPELKNDERLSIDFAHAAERVGLYELSTELSVINAQIEGAVRFTDWNGEALSKKTLCISFKEKERQGLAVGLRMAGYVKAASKKARHTQLIVDRRLVPIFSRTLPTVDVLPYPEQCAAMNNNNTYTSHIVNLWQNIGTSEKKITSLFTPLMSDIGKSNLLREKYIRQGKTKRPLIGISWFSTHFGKDLPALSDWLAFTKSFDANFVNLQYGNTKSDIYNFHKVLKERFINDTKIDQLISMDDFCNQLGALDAVVTISNTGAHLSSAMGVPTIVLRDDWFRRAWPVLSSKTPWYPNTITIGKNGRQWADVFNDVQQTLQNMIIQP